MTKETAIKLFESKKIRVHWDNEDEKWYFSIIDIIETLTRSSNPRRYWSDLKRKLVKEGYSELFSALCVGFVIFAFISLVAFLYHTNEIVQILKKTRK